ncbi:MAG: hypothetical protein R3F59_02135 [Myxococcota bacterium]
MDETLKLHEVVAIRKGVKARTYGELTELHKENQKSALFNGMTKEFKPKDADGETFPDESQRVQRVAEDILKKARRLRSEALDIEATQEYGNLGAKADVVVDGVTVLKDVPATLLIHLEKELSDLRSFVGEMPTLDEARSWSKDPNSSLYRSDTAITHKTKKVSRPIVKYDAVIKDGQALPAQTEMISEDVVIGHWHTTYTSGALPVPRKEELLERVDKLRDAVKRARARANDTEVSKREIGGALFGYLFG